MKELVISGQDCGQRLDKYLSKYLSQAPKGFIYKMMRKKNITLNKGKCDGTEKLSEGDKICLFFSDETLEKFAGTEDAVKVEAVKDELQVIYEDAHVMFVNKRSGELSQKAKESDVSLVEQIIVHALDKGLLTKENLKTCRPSVCNRLDRNTSGLVTAGLSLPGLAFLSEQLKTRDVKKYYLCLVHGTVDKPSHLKGFLAKDEKTNKVFVAAKKELLPAALREEALWIETAYQPLTVSKKATLLLVHLITGRSHQIRAHLSSIGHPIIGDVKYGNQTVNREYRDQAKTRSQLLHAYKMEFQEIKGQFSYLSHRTFAAPLPKEFIDALRYAGISLPEEIADNAF